MKSVVSIDKNIDLANLTESGEKSPVQRRSVREFLQQLKQRRVCRTAITYVLFVWLNLQIGDVLVPMIGLPPWTLELIIILGAMGLPTVLLLAWMFQVTPDGIVVDNSESSSGRSKSGWFDTTVSVFLLLISVVLTILLTVDIVTKNATSVTHGSDVLIHEMRIFTATEESVSLAKSLEAEVRHRIVNLDGVALRLQKDPVEGIHDRGIAIIASVSNQKDRYHVLLQLVDSSTGLYLSSSAINRDFPSIEDSPEVVLADDIIEHILPHI